MQKRIDSNDNDVDDLYDNDVDDLYDNDEAKRITIITITIMTIHPNEVTTYVGYDTHYTE